MSKRKAEDAFETNEHEMEIWKSCHDLHEVSSLGKVRRKSDKRPLHLKLGADGYLYCHIKTQTKYKTHAVHKLVASAFLIQTCTDYTVDHINRKRDDNRLENLRWSSPKQQVENQHKSGNQKRIPVGMVDGGNITEFENTNVAAKYIIKKFMLSAKEASVVARISASCTKGITYKGYSWQYVLPLPKGEVKEIPGSRGYLISSCGMIRNTNKHWTFGLPQQGYARYQIWWEDGTRSSSRVHRLVASAFVEGRTEERCYVNHINGLKTDNRCENLEWVSPSANSIHAILTGLKPSKGRNVSKIDTNDGEIVETYKSIQEAARSNSISRTLISRCINGDIECAHGYTWKSVDKTENWNYSESKSVKQIDKVTGETIKTHGSVRSAVKEVGTSVSNITMCITGQSLTASGYRWEYV